MRLAHRNIILLVAVLLLLLFVQRFWTTSHIKEKHLQSTPSTALKKKGPCKRPADEMHVCWIGEDILSLEGEYYKVLKSKASSDNLIFLASVDSSFIDMAVNMYATSFRRFNITNFLYVCSDNQAVVSLARYGIGCFLYHQKTKNEKATEYGTKDFILKMRVKMKMVTAALMLGFTTVLTDIDIVFFRDPTANLKTDADISLMSDVVMDNCGFYIAKPTPAGIKLHKETLKAVMTHVIADQDAISGAIKKMVSSKSLRKSNLGKKEFACGLVYFEQGERMFFNDNPCTDKKCVTDVVHNNWIVSKPAKIYRFKETGLWMYDHDGYYSSKSRKYLTYSNPVDFDKENKNKEKAALVTALTIAKLLNRTLIFPMFHCYGCNYQVCKIAADHCSFNTHYHVRTFDQYFENRYREHVYLNHSLVPDAIKNSLSPVTYISSKDMEAKIKLPNNIRRFNATDYSKGQVAASDIIQWFGKGPLSTFNVLNFHSLYVKVLHKDKAWTDTVNKALRWSDYRQYKILG